jgi:tetratricopeptide (TPR) repeat protein
MRQRARFTVPLLLTVVLAIGLGAGVPLRSGAAAPPTVELELTNGGAIRGELIRETDTGFVIRGRDGIETPYPVRSFTPAAVFDARRALALAGRPGTIREWSDRVAAFGRLSDFCLANDLYERHSEALRQAYRASVALAREAAAAWPGSRAFAASHLQARADMLRKEGRKTDALALYEQIYAGYSDVTDVQESVANEIDVLRTELNLPGELPETKPVPKLEEELPDGAAAGGAGDDPEGTPAAGGGDDTSGFSRSERGAYSRFAERFDELSRVIAEAEAAYSAQLGSDDRDVKYAGTRRAADGYRQAIPALRLLRDQLGEFRKAPILLRKVNARIESAVRGGVLVCDLMIVYDYYESSRSDRVEAALKWINAILAIDPGNERAHRHLITLSERLMRNLD